MPRALHGPLASSRLTLREDGLVEYRLKRPMPNGCAVLVLKPLDFLERLAALVPPVRRHLLHFHGGFAPNARMRPKLVALARPADEESVAPAPVARPQAELPLLLPAPPKRPRLGVVTNQDTARRVLTALGRYAELPATTGPPRRAQSWSSPSPPDVAPAPRSAAAPARPRAQGEPSDLESRPLAQAPRRPPRPHRATLPARAHRARGGLLFLCVALARLAMRTGSRTRWTPFGERFLASKELPKMARS